MYVNTYPLWNSAKSCSQIIAESNWKSGDLSFKYGVGLREYYVDLDSTRGTSTLGEVRNVEKKGYSAASL